MEGRFFSEHFGTKIGRVGAAAPELESHKVNLLQSQHEKFACCRTQFRQVSVCNNKLGLIKHGRAIFF
jgi:hypothetical protein